LKFSLNNCDGNIHTGYGYATHKIIHNVGKTKHSLLIEREAPIEVTFGHPQFYKFHGKNSYKIGYTAWESTELKPKWEEYMSHVDEIWTPNNFCKEVFEAKTGKPTYVFPHGIDSTWNPIKRKVEDKVKFLHMGYPAYRKNAHDTVNAFLELYAGSKDHELTIKSYSNGDLAINEPNIKIINDTLLYTELADLMGQHHVMLYPSWGEGFGLIPLQALGTGLPVVMTDGWCDYKMHCPELVIDSTLAYNPWQDYHPGKMFKPDYDHFVSLIKYSADNVEEVVEKQYNRAYDVHKNWSWEAVVTNHLDSVEARLMI
jgi:glycosyltransferase involved in cell wall biosynthesis